MVRINLFARRCVCGCAKKLSSQSLNSTKFILGHHIRRNSNTRGMKFPSSSEKKMGKIPWNKGLTKATNPSLALIGVKNSANLKGRKSLKVLERELSLLADRKHRAEKAIQNRVVGKIARSMLHRVLSLLNKPKEGHTFEQLGYSAAELKNHIEGLFQLGMTWNNHGVKNDDWQIDHIKSVCEFEIGTPVSVVNALSNLRPLWALENRRRARKSLKRIKK